jgi:Ser-tRNA(Ala) deacylase AlaX
MTKKMFWENPYQTELVTEITAVDGADVRVASTIFYAFSGGQESDRGSIGGFAVHSARKDGLEIIYTLPAAHTLRVGDSVAMHIDWNRRYSLMRLHFAAELVLEIIGENLSGVEKIGAHIAEDKARIDFAWPTSISPLLPFVAERANRLIASDLPIIKAFDDIATQRRYWEIEGFARVPCGGTHVNTTGEVGPIRLKRNNIGRGKERVEVYLGGS